jgi:hypothetical protein
LRLGELLIEHVRDRRILSGAVATGEFDHFLRAVDAHDMTGAGAGEGSRR